MRRFFVIDMPIWAYILLLLCLLLVCISLKFTIASPLIDRVVGRIVWRDNGCDGTSYNNIIIIIILWCLARGHRKSERDRVKRRTIVIALTRCRWQYKTDYFHRRRISSDFPHCRSVISSAPYFYHLRRLMFILYYSKRTIPKNERFLWVFIIFIST